MWSGVHLLWWADTYREFEHTNACSFLPPMDGAAHFQHKQGQIKKKKTKQENKTSVQVSAHQQETAFVHPHLTWSPVYGYFVNYLNSYSNSHVDLQYQFITFTYFSSKESDWLVAVPLDQGKSQRLLIHDPGGRFRNLHIVSITIYSTNMSLPKMQAESSVHTYSYISPSIWRFIMNDIIIFSKR